MFFNKALEIDHKNIEIYAGMGACFQQLGQFDDAKKSYEKALSLDPESINSNWNYSQLLLLLGNFSVGWKLYETRWKTDKYARFTLPWTIQPWQGESLVGRKIIVHGEQGIGDEIFFNYFVKRLQDYGCEVHLSCNARLETLFDRSLAHVTIAKGRYLDEPQYAMDYNIDYYIPLASLPYRMGQFFNGMFLLRHG